MSRAEILTPWLGDGLTPETGYRPEVADDYAISGWEDVTGQDARNLKPDPNLYAVIIRCDDTTLAAIEADPKYTVLWSEEEDEAPL
jgi:hypothetical protein